MRKILLILLFVMVATVAEARMWTTVDGGYTACFSEKWFDDIMTFAVNGDKQSQAAYYNAKKCIILKGGIQVSRMNDTGMFSGVAHIVFKGTSLWTNIEAIK